MNQAGRIALSCAACAGVVGTGVAVHFATKKAEKKLREKGLEDAPFKEKFKEVAVDYILPASIAGATIGAIGVNCSLTGRDIAMITAAGGMSARLLTKYGNKVKEMFGLEKYEEFVKEVAHDAEDEIKHDRQIQEAKQPMLYTHGIVRNFNHTVPVVNDALFYDEYVDDITGNGWFYSSLYSVRTAELCLNRDFRFGTAVTYGSFRDYIGLEHVDDYDYVGWGQNFIDDGLCWIDIEITESEIRDTGEKYYILMPVFAPETLTETERLEASYIFSESDQILKDMSDKWQKRGEVK